MDNHQFGYRFFPKSIARAPETLVIKETKGPQSKRIVILGESAALGDPEPAFGFGRIMEKMLEARHPSTTFEVINLSMTAINSHVIYEIAKDARRLKADAWLLFIGNNEVVGPFGAGTMFTQKTPPLSGIRFNLMLQKSRLGQWFVAGRHQQSSETPTQWGGMEMFLEHLVSVEAPSLKTVYQNFQTNLEDIIELGIQSGSSVLLSTIPVNLQACPPFAADAKLEADHGENDLGTWLDQAQQHLDRQEFTLAGSLLEQIKVASPDHPDAFFLAARLAEAEGNKENAHRLYSQARDLDALRFRTDSFQNEIIRHIGKNQNDKLRFVDAATLLPIPDHSTFFYEHVHFTFEGNYRLAKIFAETVEEAFGMKPKEPENSSWLTKETCQARLGYDEWSERAVLNEVYSRLRQPPFTHQRYSDQRLRLLNERIKGLSTARRQTPGPAPTSDATSQGRTTEDRGQTGTDFVLAEQMAISQTAQGKHDNAIKLWTRVTQLAPHHQRAWYQLGQLQSQQGDLELAIESLEEAIRLNPRFVDAWNSLALAYQDKDNRKKARETFRAALTIQSDYIEAWVNLGALEEAAGDSEKALSHYQHAADLNPAYYPALINLGNLWGKLNQFEKAAQSLASATQLAPENTAAHYGLGVAYQRLGRSSESLECFRRVLTLDPSHDKARLIVGTEAGKRGDTTEALNHFKILQSQKPNSSEVLINLGIAYARNQQYAEAANCFRQILQFEPEHKQAQALLKTAQQYLN